MVLQRLTEQNFRVWGSSTSSQALEDPELWLGPCWNPGQTQKCLREMGTEVGGEDPASDSPGRKEDTDKHPQRVKPCSASGLTHPFHSLILS